MYLKSDELDGAFKVLGGARACLWPSRDMLAALELNAKR